MAAEVRGFERFGEKPEVSSDIVDTSMVYRWKTPLMLKELTFSIRDCVGCDLCQICPWEAISEGPIVEAAAGRIRDAPLIMIDEDKCCFCGICETVCIFNSISLKINGTPASELYCRLRGEHSIDREKCIPCLLCSKLCPREAISARVEVEKKEKLVKYLGEGEAEGEISIDEDKCCFCGLCELLCDAIKIFWTEPKPPDFKPAITIRVDDDSCDYCGLCEKVCPVDAIKVECISTPPREIREPKVSGEIEVDDKKCVDCGLCALKCPVEAIRVEKPLRGEVALKRIERCDPVGCHNCFNICPVKAIYPTGKEDKVAVVDEVCVYCGACENACPEDVIEVTRLGYNLVYPRTPLPWAQGRTKAVSKLIAGEKPPPSLLEARVLSPSIPEYFSLPEKLPKTPKVSQQAREEALRRLKLLYVSLNEKKLRLLLAFGDVDGAVEALAKELRKAYRHP
ncbi:MAG: ferredoxin [Thermoproteota archaeon]|nr:MAG: ferredoxin [Candidatus Korarchaeota archaeon]RLG54446.1 MAG: ferredoxin [Candidatus Korarchaeota archaeon]